MRERKKEWKPWWRKPNRWQWSGRQTARERQAAAVESREMWEATGPVRRTLVAIWRRHQWGDGMGPVTRQNGSSDETARVQWRDGTSESESPEWGRGGKRREAEGSPAWGKGVTGVRPKRCSFVMSGTGPKSVQPLRFAVFMVELAVSGFWPIFLIFRFFQLTGPDWTPVPGWTGRSGPVRFLKPWYFLTYFV